MPKGILSLSFHIDCHMVAKRGQFISSDSSSAVQRLESLSEGARGIKASLVFVKLRKPRSRDLLNYQKGMS